MTCQEHCQIAIERMRVERVGYAGCADGRDVEALGDWKKGEKMYQTSEGQSGLLGCPNTGRGRSLSWILFEIFDDDINKTIQYRELAWIHVSNEIIDSEALAFFIRLGILQVHLT